MRLVLAALSALCLSCAATGGDTSAALPVFPDAPQAFADGVDGRWRVELRTDPEPPGRGTFHAELRVLDADGHGVDGLAVALVPWMPSMSHGSNRPQTTAAGSGRYVVRDVLVYMAGRWLLRVTLVDTDGHAAGTDFDVDVP